MKHLAHTLIKYDFCYSGLFYQFVAKIRILLHNSFVPIVILLDGKSSVSALMMAKKWPSGWKIGAVTHPFFVSKHLERKHEMENT